MVYQNFEQLISKVKGEPVKRRMAVAAANDEHTLEAVFHAAKEDIIEPVLVGDRNIIDAILEKEGIHVPEENIYDCPGNAEAAAFAVQLVREGKADFIMKGSLDTKVIMKAIVDKENGLSRGRTMSHFCTIEVPGYHKMVSVVDSGMVLYPTLEQKKDIIMNTVETLRAMGYDCPKVAVLTCVEKVNPKMPETLDAQALKKMNEDGEIPGCIVEGPISYDCAMSSEIAELKGYESPVAGDADILLTPDIHAGNILGKAFTVTFGAKMAGFIVGARCPVVITSRASSALEKYHAIVVCASIGNVVK